SSQEAGTPSPGGSHRGSLPVFLGSIARKISSKTGASCLWSRAPQGPGAPIDRPPATASRTPCTAPAGCEGSPRAALSDIPDTEAPLVPPRWGGAVDVGQVSPDRTACAYGPLT